MRWVSLALMVCQLFSFGLAIKAVLFFIKKLTDFVNQYSKFFGVLLIRSLLAEVHPVHFCFILHTSFLLASLVDLPTRLPSLGVQEVEYVCWHRTVAYERARWTEGVN